jgi:hypothetical protein
VTRLNKPNPPPRPPPSARSNRDLRHELVRAPCRTRDRARATHSSFRLLKRTSPSPWVGRPLRTSSRRVGCSSHRDRVERKSVPLAPTGHATGVANHAIEQPRRGSQSRAQGGGHPPAKDRPGEPQLAPTERRARAGIAHRATLHLGDRATGSETGDHTTVVLRSVCIRRPRLERASLVPTRSHRASRAAEPHRRIWLLEPLPKRAREDSNL